MTAWEPAPPSSVIRVLAQNAGVDAAILEARYKEKAAEYDRLMALAADVDAMERRLATMETAAAKEKRDDNKPV